MTSFSFFKYFDAFELDVNVVNFVYFWKTQLSQSTSHSIPPMKTAFWITGETLMFGRSSPPSKQEVKD